MLPLLDGAVWTVGQLDIWTICHCRNVGANCVYATLTNPQIDNDECWVLLLQLTAAVVVVVAAFVVTVA